MSVLADAELMQRVWMLQGEYAAVVDDPSRLESWPELFTDDGAYAIYTRENFERGLPTAILIDDTRIRLLDRVTVIRELWKGHFDEQTTLHTVSLPRVVASEGGCVDAVTPFIARLEGMG